MHKEELRKLYLSKRLALEPSEIKEINEVLTNNLLQKIISLKPESVNVFLPIVSKNEFDCRELANKLVNLKIKVYTPVSDFKTKKMLFAAYTENTTIIEKKYGILEPKTPIYPAVKNKSITIVPLLVVDKNQNRIGYGGGFYDRYFQSNPNTYKIGVSFFPTIKSITGNTSLDIPLDDIVFPYLHKK